MNSKSATLISDPLRRGGATYEMQTHGLTEKTLIRGGWKNSNVASLYICDGLAMLPRLCITYQAKLMSLGGRRFSSTGITAMWMGHVEGNLQEGRIPSNGDVGHVLPWTNQVERFCPEPENDKNPAMGP